MKRAWMKKASILMACMFVFVSLVMPACVALRSAHVCTKVHCRVCENIAFIHTIFPGLILFAMIRLFLGRRPGAGRRMLALAGMTFFGETLVGQKIRMNN